MSVQKTKYQIKELKKQLKSTKNANDLLLLKLFVLMIVLAAAAAIIHGKINFFM